MYESPIELSFIDEMYNTIIDSQENKIFEAVSHYGISVDKEELIKALQYDRGQYEKGYADRDAEIVRCKDCKFFEYDHWEETKFGRIIVAHGICTKWASSSGGCATSEHGFCFLGDKKE